MDEPIARFGRMLFESFRPPPVRRRSARGVFVFREGDAYLGPWLLHTGSVLVVRVARSGREQVVRQIGPGELFAEVPLFQEVGAYPVSARCAAASELSLLPVAAARRALRRDAVLAWAGARALASRIVEFREAMLDLTMAEARQRLMRYLLRRIEGPHPEFGLVRLGISHQDLALLLGIRPETFSRLLAGLEAEGKLKRLSRQTLQLFLKKITEEDRRS